MNNENILIERTDEEQKRSVEIHDSFRNELLKRQLSNTENYDKSILTLSSSALAISVTFLSNMPSSSTVSHLWLLKSSWVFFLVTIVASISAYLVSNSAITKQLKIAEDYYINKLHSASMQRNSLSIVNNFLNYAVGLVFILAISTTVAFVTINIKQGEESMSTNETKVSTTVQIKKSATIPTMQQAPSTTSGIARDSALVPSMQVAPSTPPPQPTQQATKTDK